MKLCPLQHSLSHMIEIWVFKLAVMMLKQATIFDIPFPLAKSIGRKTEIPPNPTAFSPAYPNLLVSIHCTFSVPTHTPKHPPVEITCTLMCTHPYSRMHAHSTFQPSYVPQKLISDCTLPAFRNSPLNCILTDTWCLENSFIYLFFSIFGYLITCLEGEHNTVLCSVLTIPKVAMIKNFSINANIFLWKVILESDLLNY